jgi:hypothetical protein
MYTWVVEERMVAWLLVAALVGWYAAATAAGQLALLAAMQVQRNHLSGNDHKIPNVEDDI